MFADLEHAQAELDAWVEHYNHDRPHQAIDDATPASRFHTVETTRTGPRRAVRALHAVPVVRSGPVESATVTERRPAGPGQEWVARKVAVNGVACVGAQQVSVGKHHAGRHVDVLVTDQTLQFWIGAELLKTVTRADPRPIRKKRAAGTSPRP